MQSMPGCPPQKIRHLYLEDSVKLKDAQSNKMDVHCFLFTDIFLVCKPLSKKSTDGKMKVIRQPFFTDRLVVRELKECCGFLLIYLNELNVASTFLLVYTSETRLWIDSIKKAQEDYKSLKVEPGYGTYQANFDYEEMYGTHGLLSTTPRSLSRSSLIHSNSGSQEINDQNMPQAQPNSNQLSIQQQPPRAVSFELGDLRNPSLNVEDADSFARSQSMDNRSPVVTITSPRPERRAFLLRNNNSAGSKGSSGNVSSVSSSPQSTNSLYLSQNSLSVSVPTSRRSPGSSPPADTVLTPSQVYPQSQYCSSIQVSVHPPPPPPPPLPPSGSSLNVSSKRSSVKGARPLPPLPPSQSGTPPVPPPPSLLSISSRGQPSVMTMSINKPPLVKTKNVSCGVASMSFAGDKVPGHVLSIGDGNERTNGNDSLNLLPRTEMNSQDKTSDTNDDYTKSRFIQQKRTCRPDRRYHTADSIDHMKQEKDNSIHKRLSWNYGQQALSTHQNSCPCPHRNSPHHCTSASQYGHQLNHRPLGSAHPANKCTSNESVYSSSGFSSTGSVPLSVGSADNNLDHCCECCANLCSVDLQHFNEEDEEEDSHYCNPNTSSDQRDRDSALPHSPALVQPLDMYHAHSHSMDSNASAYDDNSACSVGSLHNHSPPRPQDVKIDVSESKDGISSVQITLTGGMSNVSRPSKADLKKMKDFLLSNCNAESSWVPYCSRFISLIHPPLNREVWFGCKAFGCEHESKWLWGCILVGWLGPWRWCLSPTLHYVKLQVRQACCSNLNNKIWTFNWQVTLIRLVLV